MVAVLLLVFRARWRLLALPLVGIGMVWAFGAFGYLGIPFNMVTISGLPILVGLGVDFAIQVHSRHEEEGAPGRAHPAAGRARGRRRRPSSWRSWPRRPPGSLSLRISPVPDDRAVRV